jgi:hypothetical protein
MHESQATVYAAGRSPNLYPRYFRQSSLAKPKLHEDTAVCRTSIKTCGAILIIHLIICYLLELSLNDSNNTRPLFAQLRL